MGIEALPNELLFMVFECFPIEELTKLQGVCTHWRSASETVYMGKLISLLGKRAKPEQALLQRTVDRLERIFSLKGGEMDYFCGSFSSRRGPLQANFVIHLAKKGLNSEIISCLIALSSNYARHKINSSFNSMRIPLRKAISWEGEPISTGMSVKAPKGMRPLRVSKSEWKKLFYHPENSFIPGEMVAAYLKQGISSKLCYAFVVKQMETHWEIAFETDKEGNYCTLAYLSSEKIAKIKSS